MAAILSIADPSIAEAVLAELRGIDDDVDVVPYIGGSLRRKRYELVVVASHVSSRGVHLTGDNYLSPMALGSLADSAKARTVYVGYCDASVANEIAGSAKSATIVYFGAALDDDTAQRLATSFAERYVCEGAEAAIEAARATGCNVLGAVYRMADQTGRGFGDNPDSMRLLLDMQRAQSETSTQVAYLRDDMNYVKTELRRIGDAQAQAQAIAQANAAAQSAHAAAQGVPLRNMMAVLALAIVIVFIGWIIVSSLSGNPL